MTSIWSELHEDLIHEILVWLPVKSLMRFKCVNRSWNALFTTTHSFITRYLHVHEKKEHLLCFFFPTNETSIKMLHLSDDNSVVEDVKNPFSQILPSLEHLRVFACPSYKGVFCLYGTYDDYFKIILWNPSTREVKAIPPPPSFPNYLLYQNFPSCLFLYCGFGGNPKTRDLMIINLVLDVRGPHHDTYYSAELYNLRTNSWTTLSIKNLFTNHPIYPGITPSIVLANGVCHWLLEEVTQQKCILCFHFRSNRFSKLNLPKLPSIHLTHGFIADINDSIAYVVCCKRPRGGLHVWTFERATNCWSKKYKFEPIDWRVQVVSVSPLMKKPLRIATFWKDGAEFIGLANFDGICHMVSYNSHCMPTRKFAIIPKVRRAYFIWHNRKYVESILPLSFFPST